MRIKCRVACLSICLLLLASCSKPFDSLSQLTPNNKDIAISIDRTDLRAVAISPNGKLFAVPYDGVLTQFTYDGEAVKTYPDTEAFYSLCADDNFVYAYDIAQSRFVKMNCGDGKITPLGDTFTPEEIKNLVIAGNTLYALIIACFDDDDNKSHDHSHDYTMNADGYIDFEEKLYSININNGKMTEEKSENIISIYAGSDSILYYYAYTNNEYGLYRLKNGKNEKVPALSEAGYTSAFVFENNQFIYQSLQDGSVKARNLSDGRETIIYTDFHLFSAYDLKFYAGNIILLRTYPILNINDTIEKKLFAFNIENPFGDFGAAEYPPESISIYAIENQLDNRLINTLEVTKRSNITAQYIKPPMYVSEQLAQLMAGDADIDIYVFQAAYPQTMPILKMGMYVPLNGSATIGNYLNNCFDYIAEVARSDSGDVWMLPLYTTTAALWYVPENFYQFNLSPDDVKYFDDFIETIKRLNEESAALAAYVDYPVLMADDLRHQYERTYNDFYKKTANYNTDLFTRMFSTMWGGWHRYENERHPLFRNSYLEWDNSGMIVDMPNYDRNKVIFKYDSVNTHMSAIQDPLKGWRVLPAPRLSDDVRGNISSCTYAVVNPLSKKKETAIRYLETVVQDPFAMINGHYFLYKYQEDYRGKYDSTQLGFQDLFSIYQDGIIHIDSRYPMMHDDYVDDYQAGRLTAEEAILVLQREVEMWLNE